jgi:hypothetical protein
MEGSYVVTASFMGDGRGNQGSSKFVGDKDGKVTEYTAGVAERDLEEHMSLVPRLGSVSALCSVEDTQTEVSNEVDNEL